MRNRADHDLIPAVRRTLAAHTANAADAGAVADATLALWQRLAARLEPVIGVRGVDVVLHRALKLTCACRPELQMGAHGDGGTAAASFADFTEHLAVLDRSVATEASCTLLATFIELMGTLIGESLTARLVGAALIDPARSEQEDTS